MIEIDTTRLPTPDSLAGQARAAGLAVLARAALRAPDENNPGTYPRFMSETKRWWLFGMLFAVTSGGQA